jgi:hypothetical protein
MTWIAALLLAQEARDVLLGDRPVEIRVPVSADARHPATVVTFPEESLEALVAGWNEGDLSVERRRENLFLKLLRRAEGDLHVLGVSGTLYRLALRPADGAYDGHVRLLVPRAKAAREPAPLELIRAMRLGRRPENATVLRAEGLLYAGPDVATRAAYIYDTDALRGYVLRVENTSAATVRVDPSRFTGRQLVLAGARDMVLEPGARTLVYLVFGKTP